MYRSAVRIDDANHASFDCALRYNALPAVLSTTIAFAFVSVRAISIYHPPSDEHNTHTHTHTRERSPPATYLFFLNATTDKIPLERLVCTKTQVPLRPPNVCVGGGGGVVAVAFGVCVVAVACCVVKEVARPGFV